MKAGRQPWFYLSRRRRTITRVLSGTDWDFVYGTVKKKKEKKKWRIKGEDPDVGRCFYKDPCLSLSLSSLSCSAPLIRNEEYRGTIRYPIENGCRYRETLNLPVCANSSQTWAFSLASISNHLNHDGPISLSLSLSLGSLLLSARPSLSLSLPYFCEAYIRRENNDR